MQTGHKRWTAFASATAAVVAIGCGDLTTDTAPGGASDPSVETKASAVETKPSAVATPSGVLEPRTRFFIPPPNPGAVQQIVDLAKERKLIDAARITAMEATPHAVWFTDGSPSDVKAAVRKTVKAAALLHTVPVLVAYNVPFRDCAQYSAGGALDAAAYEAVDRRLRRRDRQRARGRGHPRARRPGHHPLQRASRAGRTSPRGGATVPALARTRRALRADQLRRRQHPRRRAQRARLPRRHPQRLAGRRATSRIVWRALASAARRGSSSTRELPVRRRQLMQYGAGSRAASRTPPRSRPAASGLPDASRGRRPAPVVEIADQRSVELDPRWTRTDVARRVDTVATPMLSRVNLRCANMLGRSTPAAVHFVIDTSRNGLGPLDVTPFGAAPYNQPAGVARRARTRATGATRLAPGSACARRRTRARAPRCLPLDQGAGRVGRLVRHRRRGAGVGLHRLQPVGRPRCHSEQLRPAVGHDGSGGGRLVHAAGARARPESHAAAVLSRS